MTGVQTCALPISKRRRGKRSRRRPHRGAATKRQVVSRQGMQKLDKMSTEILNEMIQNTPKLKIYS